MQLTATSGHLTLQDVKQHFDHWRATRVKRGKIPDSLWQEVKTLIGRYPAYHITQTLGVNAYQIATGVTHQPDITFVAACSDVKQLEAPVMPAPDINTCSLEIHRPNGVMLKITDFPVVSLASVINQLMG